MRDCLFRKGLVPAIIILFISMSVFPSTGNIVFNDDNTPPVTTYTLDPSDPNGCNNWYISNVTVTLNATDDMSGVKAIYYRIAGGNWENHTGDFLVFIVDYDCLVGLIEFYSVDYAGNQEEIKSVDIAIDQKPPEIELEWEVYKEGGVWLILFTAKVEDACSGINRLEFYLDDNLLEIIEGAGPCIWSIPMEVEGYSVFGLICNQESTEENISFFALVVWTKVQFSYNSWKDFKIKVYDDAGNWVFNETIGLSPPGPKPYFFTHFTFQNNYEGYIGKFLIYAMFEKEPLETTLRCN